MQQKEDEPLEDYLEWFMFCVQKSKHTTDIPPDSLKLLFLKGLSDEDMDALDLIGAGDISKASFEEICDACKNYSRATMKRVRNVRSRGGLSTKTMGDISKSEIVSMFKNMKQEIVNDMANQLDALHAKKKKEDAEATLIEYYHSCRRKKSDCRCRELANISQEREASPDFKMLETEDGKVFY
ncbi:hypothetical protein KI387_039974, partial [Taxus chinensis]